MEVARRPVLHRGGPPRRKTRKTPLDSGRGRPRKNPEPDTGQRSAQSTAVGIIEVDFTINYNFAKAQMMDATGQLRPFDVHLIETDDPRFRQSVIPRPALWRLGWRDVAYAQGWGIRWTRLVVDGGGGQIMMNLLTMPPLEEDVSRDEVFLTRAALASLLKNAPAADQDSSRISAEESQTPSATYVKQQ